MQCHELHISMPLLNGKIPLLYVINTDGYYGTERMALATALELQDDFNPTLVAPPGRAADEARTLGIDVLETASARATGGLGTFDFWRFASTLQPLFHNKSKLAIISTHLGHLLTFSALSQLHRCKLAQLYVVHGSPELSIGSCMILNSLPVRTVAVSRYTRERLVARGVEARRISVIENFLTREQLRNVQTRGPFIERGIRRVAIISRLVPAKRIDLLLDCLQSYAELRDLSFHIYGEGVGSTYYADALRDRAARSYDNVFFEGYRDDVAQRLAESDLLLHLCPSEPFGLVVLEAMAAGVPALVPNRGGAADIIKNGNTGLHFVADDVDNLASVLLHLRHMSAQQLNAMVEEARAELRTRFYPSTNVKQYSSLLIKGRFRTLSGWGRGRVRRSGIGWPPQNALRCGNHELGI